VRFGGGANLILPEVAVILLTFMFRMSRIRICALSLAIFTDIMRGFPQSLKEDVYTVLYNRPQRLPSTKFCIHCAYSFYDIQFS
jgi:hypothetical protein